MYDIFSLALWATSLALYFSVIGAPLIAVLNSSDTKIRKLLSFFLAPAVGMSVYLMFGMWLHYVGVSGRFDVLLIFVLAILLSLFVFRHWKRCELSILLYAIGVVAMTLFVGTCLNGLDYRNVSLINYFPLTNGDTFSYLGHVDQVRSEGWFSPLITYPAGYAPNIVDIRFPGVALVADIAEAFGLQSHVAFFLVQHLSIAVVALAASGLAGWLTSSLRTAAFCFILLIGGNFLLDQALQQFNSSTMGTIVAVPTLWLVGWTIAKLDEKNAAQAGSALVGALSGTMAMASPESASLYLVMLGLVFFLAMGVRRDIKMLWLLPIYMGAFALASLPFLARLFEFIMHQGVAGAKMAPWVAAPGILVQYAGIRFTSDPNLFHYHHWTVAATLLFVAVSIAAAVILDRRSGKRLELLSVAVPGTMFMLVGLFLGLAGMGYIMLKSIDYSAFLPPVLVSVAAAEMPTMILAAMAIMAFWLPPALLSKVEIMKIYNKIIVTMPAVEDYKIPRHLIPASTLVIPDLERDSLNLFLYVNRYGDNQIISPASGSYRFAFRHEKIHGNEIVARLLNVGIAGHPLADITAEPSVSTTRKLLLEPAPGQVLVIRSNNWLDPEGNSVGSLFRWLSGSGKFVVLGPKRSECALSVRLYPGPDFHDDNGVRIMIGGKVVAATTVLPTTLTVPLGAIPAAGLQGSIEVTGKIGGPRQISVSSLICISPLPIGEVYRFGAPEHYRDVESYGVSGIENAAGRWTDNEHVKLSILLSSVPSRPVSLSLRVRPFLVPGVLAQQRVKLKINGRLIAARTFTKQGPSDWVIPLPSGLILGKHLNVELLLPDSRSPLEVAPPSTDKRRLGLFLEALSLQNRSL